LLKDETVTSTMDERGWPLRVCDLANYAISRLRAAQQRGPIST
jgi:hypothetical protein